MTRRPKPTRVGCDLCGWRGQRRWHECEHDTSDYGYRSCSCPWGLCPKCKASVQTMARIRELRAMDKEASTDAKA